MGLNFLGWSIFTIDGAACNSANLNCISLHIQPDKPMMVMEFWSGWFYHWGEESLRRNQDPEQLAEATTKILKAGASLNYYMFHGR